MRRFAFLEDALGLRPLAYRVSLSQVSTKVLDPRAIYVQEATHKLIEHTLVQRPLPFPTLPQLMIVIL